ncbi:MAG: hypothetical protein FGM57_02475 [Candidatus Taylorbacteria bacterium]|nr:hypothetical protein [Candidatus Taylorbacteria bacterium]
MKTLWREVILPVIIIALLATALLMVISYLDKTSQVLATVTIVQTGLIIMSAARAKNTIAPWRVTFTTLSLYLLAGQLTFMWANSLIPFNSITNLANGIFIVLFVFAFMSAPSGEIKKAKIARTEWFGSPFRIPGLDRGVTLGQGNVTYPATFCAEILDLRTPYFLALSLETIPNKAGSKADCTMGVNIQFKNVDPNRLDEFKLDVHITPAITEMIADYLRRWAATITEDMFIGKVAPPLLPGHPRAVTAMQQASQIIRDALNMQEAKSKLNDFGLMTDLVACTDPKKSAQTNEAEQLRKTMDILMQGSGNLGIGDAATAANIALVLGGKGFAITTSGGKKGAGGIIADLDETSTKGGKKGGAKATEEKKEDKPNPPKAGKGKAPTIVLIVWGALALIQFIGWGKNQQKNGDNFHPGQIVDKAKQVKVQDVLPPKPKSLKDTVILTDNGDQTWITSSKVNEYGLRDTDKDGWITNKAEGYRRCEVLDIEFSVNRPTDIVVIEAELQSGEIVTFASDEIGWYQQLENGQKSRVAFLRLLRQSVKMRFKVTSPMDGYPLTITVKRESFIN